MSKPNKKIVEKLRFLSELSYDNVVRISESGNYYVRLSSPTDVNVETEIRPETVTRGTFGKLHVKVKTRYQTYQNMLMLTKTGKLMLGAPKPVNNSFKKGIKWVRLTALNYRKQGYWLKVEGKDYAEIRPNLLNLVLHNSKAKWLLDKPFFICPNGLYHRILFNYKSLSEMRKDLGYGFLTDKTFERLLTHLKLSDDGEPENMDYVIDLFNIILYGKLFSEKSRKNLIVVLLNVIATYDEAKIFSAFSELTKDFHDYIKIRRIVGRPLAELPNDLKELTKTLVFAFTVTSNSDDDDEDLPF